MNKKVFVTGSSGLIGSQLVSRLLEEKYKVICYDVKSPKKKIYNNNIKFFNGSILDKKKLKKSIGNSEFIIHLAAYLGVKNTEDNKLNCLDINIEGTKNLLEIAKSKKIKKFIFASSSEIYGEQKKFPINESAEPKLKSIYGLSKIVSENYVKSYNQKYNLNYNIIRFFNVYGNEQNKHFVITKFVNQLKKNKPLKIFGKGNQVRSFCHVKDAINGLIKVLKLGKKNTTYNVGNNLEPISIMNLSKKIIKFSKLRGKIKKIKFENSDRSKEREINKRIPDIKLIKLHTNYKPMISIKEGIIGILKQKKILK